MQTHRSAGSASIIVASGFGLKVYVERGHLVVHDGTGSSRETRSFGRATSGLKRVIVIGHTGFVTLEALRWIRDVGATFVQVDGDGQLVAVSAAERFHNAKLRRAQVLAAEGASGLDANRALLRAKLEGQARVAERLSYVRPTLRTDRKTREITVAQAIRERLAQLEEARDFAGVRVLESMAGRYYWQTWARVPVRFDRGFGRSVPEHWLRAGPRFPARTKRARPEKAITPVHALLNYSYAILETEATIALHKLGFDPSLGLMHTDRHYRASLASDLMEAVRPVADGFVLDLLERRELVRGDVFESRSGVCRLGPPLVRELAESSPRLREALAPHAEQLAATLLRSEVTTPLTRRRHRASRGHNVEEAVA